MQNMLCCSRNVCCIIAPIASYYYSKGVSLMVTAYHKKAVCVSICVLGLSSILNALGIARIIDEIWSVFGLIAVVGSIIAFTALNGLKKESAKTRSKTVFFMFTGSGILWAVTYAVVRLS